MRYRQLGDSELQVSELALGTWLTHGVTIDRDWSRACFERAFDLGINFIDTANMYGKGAAESVIGDLLSRYDRENYVLATKVFFPMSETDRGLSRAQIHKQIDGSLSRLKTDYVDLYQCHRFDRDTPLEETMMALSEVVDAGKARYIGFSQWTPRQIRSAAALDNAVRFVSSQPQYSMLRRSPERRVFPLCRGLGIGQVVWSPLAQGVLTGKYLPNKRPPQGSRLANARTGRKMKGFTEESVLAAVQGLRPIAERLSLSMSQLALAWVLREKCVSAAIIGAKNPDQIEENVGAVGVKLDESTLEAVDTVLIGAIRS